MDTGFNYYHERRSVGVRPRRLELRGRARAAARARRAPGRGGLLGRRPGVLRTAGGREGDTTCFFYGYGDKFRRDWMQAMVGEPSRALPGRRLRARRPRLPGRHRQRARDRRHPVQRLRARDLGGARSTSTSRAARTRPSTRRRRAARSSSRRRARRSSRTRTTGIERWFEPGRELLVVDDADEAIDGVPRAARRSRRRPRSWARARASACSTSTRTRHRARRLLVARRTRASVAAREREPDRDRARVQRGGRDRRRDRRDPRLRPEFDVVVVDDGSHDATAEVARARGARVVTLPFNLGIGGAVQTGLPLRARARLRARGPRRRRRPARSGASSRR